jgi:pyruvate dehydrogenase E2 component (dihydrolipoyllysine-residue acetyltransferase)
MATELKLPELGENIDTAVVGSILVAPGDSIRKDQPVIEVETDKATAEVPSPFEGVVKEIRVSKGNEIKVGEVILTLEAGNGGAQPPPPRAAAVTATATAKGETTTVAADAKRAAPDVAAEKPAARPSLVSAPSRPAPASRPAAAAVDRGGTVPAAPAVRRLARELGIDVAAVPGSGPGGRISGDDVTQYARGLITGRGTGAGGGVAAGGMAAGGAPIQEPGLPDFARWGEVTREPLSGVRRKTAEHLSLAWNVIPHVTQHDQADITELEAFRRRHEAAAAAGAAKLTVTAIAIKIVAEALRRFPRFNASLDPAAGEVILKKYVHIGVAVDAGHGLLVPVLRDADRKGVMAIATELRDLSRKARDRKLSVDEMRGAGFTVSNLGGLGTTYFSPIVNWPEVAILGLGRAALQPVFRDGAFAPRLILPLSVSYDHRLIDGADAARFLRWIAEALEQPLKLVLED